MADHHGLVVALEKYATLAGVRHARADGEAIVDALREVGYSVPDSAVLFDSVATKATIESRLRTELAGLGPEDRFVFYFAGHGLALNGQNYITCFDTQPMDLERTSIPLSTVYEALRASGTHQGIVFLDSCHAGLNLPDTARSVIDTLSAAELQEFFNESEFYLCFASCKTDEQSVSSPDLGHGIWTYHLVEALRGEAPDALTRDGHLIASALQDHLSVSVPRSVRKYVKTHRQTPWLFGGSSREALIADLQPILQRLEARRIIPIDRKVHEFRLVGARKQPVKELDGFFRMRHHVPYEVNDWTRSFVRACATPDLKNERDEFFTKIRKEFGYKRKDLEVHAGDGEVSIIAPDFTFVIGCEQHDSEPDQAVRSYRITEIVDLAILDSEAFKRVFEDVLEQFELVFDRSIDIEAIIDALEASPLDGVEVDYPRDCGYCDIEFSGTRNRVRMEPFTMSFDPGRITGPRSLIEGFRSTFEDLAAHPKVGLQFRRALGPSSAPEAASESELGRLPSPENGQGNES